MSKVAKANRIKAHFAHANGFPSGSYKLLFEHMAGQLDIFALDKFAHNPRFPLNDNWLNQVDELIEHVEQNANEKVLALGHSFGAVISYIACCKRPELFSGLIMLDPPLATGLSRHIFRFAKTNRLINKVTPAHKTQIRKQRWHKDEDLVEYFSARALFKDMDKRCIKDYVHSVTALKGEHRHLMFDRDIEAQIFRTLPHNLPDYYGKLKCPAKLITARFTTVCVPRLRQPFLKYNQSVEHDEIAVGGHMFPLEHPNLVANKIIATLKAWNVKN
jgi:pimeloyl-ACP methyl ester carboxylesterase